MVKRTPGEPAAHIRVEHDGPTMTITLDRPLRRNALTVHMVDTINASIQRASDDDATRAVVITASGADFCAGMDLAESNRPDDPHAADTRPRAGHLQRRLDSGTHRMVLTMAAAQVPIVAGVRGWAAGAGTMLALSADVVVATPDTRFWVPFVGKGFTPDSGTTWLLPRLVGLARAKEMVLRGKAIGGEQAADWGLISRCVPESELDAAVAEVAAELAASATVAVGLARVLLHENLSVALPAALHNEAIHEELAVRSDDFKEGMRAFSQKRAAEFTGR
ncbi:MAG: enoyl-CoA hydratase/isomerase family protein [Acidimicrobiia bacterium]